MNQKAHTPTYVVIMVGVVIVHLVVVSGCIIVAVLSKIRIDTVSKQRILLVVHVVVQSVPP